ncbi:hypothetical protein [Halospeciosus flavus]|uniref:Uncharacterized protein n=1 Tax=Halospeciosus flavus TaxID=3032283 RepID=A0ABD5Z2T4_9EURY|nr:hypothetical protein [Halospeciosus flavus]
MDLDWETHAERAQRFESWVESLSDRAADDPSFATYLPEVDAFLDRLSERATAFREHLERRANGDES